MRKVVISSPVATQSGYGHHAREIIKQFIDKKSKEWEINLLSMPWGNTPFTYPISSDWKQRFIGLPLQTKPDIWVQITVPNEFQAVGQYNIGVTAGTEGSVCNPEWIDRINQMQLIIVPSEFTKKTFEDTATQSGKPITTNIQVISEYFDDTVYSNKNVTTSIPALDSIKEKNAFLMCGHWLQGNLGEDRKNISGALHCFFTAFKDKQRSTQPALVLKTSGATYSVTDRWEIEKRIEQVRNMFGTEIHKLPPVYLLHGDLTNAEMNALYNHPKIKAMVSFTKAEGFGRPLLEFASTGKPIMAPHYSGQADFLKKEFICALPGTLTNIHESAANDFLLKEAQWFTVDYGYASKMFVDILKNTKKWNELSKRQRYFVNSNFTETVISKRYDEVLKHIDTGIESIPKHVELKLPKLKLPKLQKV
jgi:glycosyltransferase involved in cell wall biosynthesis|tara:strand:+ start:21320 stop:22582 length:1263 start_codon:yes stop_codon:yes gene_type:complete